ncbi:unnamed protein product, partial [Fusarium graminearum]
GITVSTEVLSREGNNESALILLSNQKKTKRIEAIVRTRLHCFTQAKVVDTGRSATGHQQKTKNGQTVPCRNVKAGARDPGNCLNRKHQNKTCRIDVCALDEHGITSSVDPESKNKYGKKKLYGRLVEEQKGSACVVLTRHDQIDLIPVSAMSYPRGSSLDTDYRVNDLHTGVELEWFIIPGLHR